jgi:hypothetical protein
MNVQQWFTISSYAPVKIKLTDNSNAQDLYSEVLGLDLSWDTSYPD